jgi:hypothetical protein
MTRAQRRGLAAQAVDAGAVVTQARSSITRVLASLAKYGPDVVEAT